MRDPVLIEPSSFDYLPRLPEWKRIGHVGVLAGERMTGRGEGEAPDGMTTRYASRFLRGPEMRRSRADKIWRRHLESHGVIFFADGRMASRYHGPLDPKAYLQECEVRDRVAQAEWDKRMQPSEQAKRDAAAVDRGVAIGDPDAIALRDLYERGVHL